MRPQTVTTFINQGNKSSFSFLDRFAIKIAVVSRIIITGSRFTGLLSMAIT